MNISERLAPVAGFVRRHPFALVALALAGSALLVQRRTRQTERANPPEGKFIEVDGVRLHYIERGKGEPLLLLHGNGTMIREMEISGLIDLAADHYRVIAFDRPGYGYSTRPRGRLWTPRAQAKLLYEALRRLGVERPVVVGHSWGTQVALAYALEYPSEVRRLVLLSGYYFPTIRFDVPLLSPPAIPLFGDVLRYTISPWIGRLIWPLMLKRIFGPAPVPPRFAAFPVWMALRPSQLRAAAVEAALMIPDAMALRERYRDLDLPVMIMAGEDDRHVDAHRQSARLHKELPQSDLRLVPGVGHMIHHSVPRQVMEAIDAVAIPYSRGRTCDRQEDAVAHVSEEPDFA
ncbi:alpha/beta fold hydrolase [Methylomagnum sp.]